MAPQQLIIVTVFDKDDAGTLYPAGEPRRFDTEAGAVQAAKELASHHDGVIAWVRSAVSGAEEYGPAKVLYSAGEAVDME